MTKQYASQLSPNITQCGGTLSGTFETKYIQLVAKVLVHLLKVKESQKALHIV